MRFLQSLVLSVAMAATGAASAGLTTIGFNEVPITPMSTVNLDIGGYRVSPPCHIDAHTDPAYSDGVAIGWDWSGCWASIYNADYLGAAIPGFPGMGRQLYIDRAGHEFDLVSFVAWGNDGATGPTVLSSKGGHVSYSLTWGERQEYLFSGDEWKDVEWILLLNGGGGPNWWMDNITLNSVPEPTGLSLLGLAGLAAFSASQPRSRCGRPKCAKLR